MNTKYYLFPNRVYQFGRPFFLHLLLWAGLWLLSAPALLAQNVQLSLIPNPDAVGSYQGYFGYPIVFNNALYGSYQNARGGYQLAKYDGTSLSLINNPDAAGGGYGYFGISPIVFNNALYGQYSNAGGGQSISQIRWHESEPD